MAVLKISDTFQVPFRAAWHPADPAEALFAVGPVLDTICVLPWTQNDFDTALYIPLVILYTEHAGCRQNDFNVHG